MALEVLDLTIRMLVLEIWRSQLLSLRLAWLVG